MVEDEAVRPWWLRGVDAAERLLGSRTLSLAAFAILSHKLITAAGFQFDEWILAMILYINFSARIEAMSDRSHLLNTKDQGNGE